MAKGKSNKNRWYIAEVKKSYVNKANKALKVIGVFLVGDAKLRCVVDTGNLKNSIADDYEDLTLGVGTVVEYAPAVELGTEKQAEQPFLKPALDENHAAIQQLFTKMMVKK